jgi:hypothetical protein
LDGALRFTFDNVPHAAEAVVDTDDLDIFIPRRQDWINKEDSYLRGGVKK